MSKSTESKKERQAQRYKKWASNNRELLREKNKKYLENNPDKKLQYGLSKYKLDISVYREILASQEGMCAICKGGEEQSQRSRLSVDHDASTNHIRGLLCTACNTAIGLFKHEINLLRAAITYLENTEMEFDDN